MAGLDPSRLVLKEKELLMYQYNRQHKKRPREEIIPTPLELILCSVFIYSFYPLTFLLLGVRTLTMRDLGIFF